MTLSTEDSGLTRRGFVRAAAGAACALGGASAVLGDGPTNAQDKPAAPAPAPAPAKPLPPAADRPKIGCVSWCFHSFTGGVDPTEAIDTMGDLGFEGTDLILTAREDVQGFWTQMKIDSLRARLEKHHLALAQFVLFWPVVDGLASLDPEERKKSLEHFEAGCEIGKRLGAPVINIVAPWPRELKGPGGYLPRFFELQNPKAGEKFHIEIDPGFDWNKVWQVYVDATRSCLEVVKKRGLKLSIEHHTHCLVPDAGTFLRLWDAVRDPDLGYNLDTGWTLLQREYPPLAIHKVGNHLMNLHLRDIDAQMRTFVHVGDGVMDFKAVVDALKAVGYRGYMSIEQDKYPGDMRATCRKYIETLKAHLSA